MKIIDLLNKIANREEVPKKIKYKNKIYERYQNITTNNLYYYQVPNKNDFLIYQLEAAIDLLDEVEIIEEEPKKIEKIARCDDAKMTHYGELHKPTENEEMMKNTNMNTANTFNHSNQFNEVENAFNNTMMNFQTPESNIPPIEEMELPTNVAVLRQLISKLPSNVSKQTGAMIIKQTMEALGISMTNVLQEAQQVQENLTQSVRECQTSVLEHKKQINILEVQAQKYQRQFAAVNDIISLFIQTNN